ncbi:hypothetical protein N180_03095 [Pedobacter antarcticus 4BY]|uniref:HTH cro/C1-type domain-containing protein n=2 Tax=Pedobacter antarcticus TaxID=34086 RepID=A0A081PKM5_9SPHI|nr:helix-turn-helix transcriptional regulator [Pedobacter antarcticus]KEQ31248.1 hypothetical protein N180_03095 [Pedobacter antarcticus 4BY]SFE56298.1 Helix-turn-helix [Pedobacter antarcticus]
MALRQEKLTTDETKRFKILRETEGLTQTKFAEMLELTQPTIQRYESGAYIIPIDVIKKAHEVFNMSFEWFFFGKGDRKVKASAEKGTQLGGFIKDMKTLSTNQQLLENQVSTLKNELYKLLDEFNKIKSKTL